MSKLELIDILKGYTSKQAQLKAEASRIALNDTLSQMGKAEARDKLVEGFYPTIDNTMERINTMLDSTITGLRVKWNNATVGMLDNLDYQNGIQRAGILIKNKMVAGSDLTNIVEKYKNDFFAIAYFKSFMEYPDTLILPEDIRDITIKSLEDVRETADGLITRSKALEDVDIFIQSLINYIETKLDNNLEYIRAMDQQTESRPVDAEFNFSFAPWSRVRE